MNLGQLVDRASHTLGAGADPIHGTEEYARLVELANEAVLNLLARTRINVRCIDLSLEAGEREYDFGNQILKIHNLKIGNRELQEVSPGDVHRAGSYHFAIAGYNRLVVGWDWPAATVAEAWYTPRPTPMDSDDDDPWTEAFGRIPPEFHPAIINYMCWHGADIFGDAGSGRGERYRILYEGETGTGEVGSDIGRIRTMTNQRASAGSSHRRIQRQFASDGVPAGRDDYWRG